VVVEFVQHEILETPQTLYNFEVDGNNNYYVSENTDSSKTAFVLVHNYCKYDKVYKGIDTVTGKPYFGKTGQDVSKRVGQHATGKIKRVLVDVEYLDNLTDAQSRKLEQALINQFDSLDDISNRMNGISQAKYSDLFNEVKQCGDDLLKLFEGLWKKL
jgi:hypothetical protein